MAKFTVTESTSSPMEMFTKGTGKMAKNTGRVLMSGPTALNTSCPTTKARRQALV